MEKEIYEYLWEKRYTGSSMLGYSDREEKWENISSRIEFSKN